MPQLVSGLGFAARKVIPRKNVCVGGMRFLHKRGQRFRPDVSRGLDFHGDYLLSLIHISDGIAGAYTYAAIQNLHHSWVGKAAIHEIVHLGFARAAGVLERNALCLFGTEEFARSVASRMSNLSLATNPQSKIISADSLLVAPDESMLLVHIVLPEEEAVQKIPRVSYEDEATLPLRLEQAIAAARKATPRRIAIELPGRVWEDAGEGRSAQHFAITLLDALCTALS